VIVLHSEDNHYYLLQTRDCTTKRRKLQLPSTEKCFYHTAETITTTYYKHVIVPQSRKSQLPGTDT